MREINIEIYDDKTINIKNKNLGDKFDNQITNIFFDFSNSEFSNNLKYKYFYYKNNHFDGYKIIDISNINNIVLDYEFTRNYGDYNCLILMSDEIIEDFENDQDIFVSNSFILNIKDNFLIDINNLDIRENKEGL
jgi:hypothetical protein